MEEVIQVSYTGRSPGQWFKWDCVFADGWRYVAVLSVKYAQTQIIWEYEIPGSLEQKGEKKKKFSLLVRVCQSNIQSPFKIPVMFCQMSVIKKQYQYNLSCSALYSTIFISNKILLLCLKG